jgi:hypothetical protein
LKSFTCRGAVHVQLDAGFGDLDFVLLDEGVDLAADRHAPGQPGLLEAGAEQGFGGEDRAFAFNAVVVAEVFGFQRQPARVDLGGRTSRKVAPSGFFSCRSGWAAWSGRGRSQPWPGAGRRQVFLRLRQHGFDLLRAPFHLLRQRR